MGNYEFNSDLKASEISEHQVAGLLRRVFNMNFIYQNDDFKYDLLMESRTTGENVTVEVKEDSQCKDTGNIFVEYRSRGKPTGINMTQADYYAFKIFRPDGTITVDWIPTWKLVLYIKENRNEIRQGRGGDAGSNTFGWLLPLNTVDKLFQRVGELKE